MEFTRIINCYKNSGNENGGQNSKNFGNPQNIMGNFNSNSIPKNGGVKLNSNSIPPIGGHGYKNIGIPQLDNLFKSFAENNNSTYIIILRNKNKIIENFIELYKAEAGNFGKIFYKNFAVYPDVNAERNVYDKFEGIHILRINEYVLGLSGWLPEIELKHVGFIAKEAHPMLFDAAKDMIEENGQYVSNSIDISSAHAYVAVWMRNCIEIFKNLSRLPKLRRPQLVYYKGGLKKLSIYFLFFLSRLGCNILIDPDASTDISHILTGLPSYIQYSIVDGSEV